MAIGQIARPPTGVLMWNGPVSRGHRSPFRPSWMLSSVSGTAPTGRQSDLPRANTAAAHYAKVRTAAKPEIRFDFVVRLTESSIHR